MKIKNLVIRIIKTVMIHTSFMIILIHNNVIDQSAFSSFFLCFFFHHHLYNIGDIFNSINTKMFLLILNSIFKIIKVATVHILQFQIYKNTKNHAKFTSFLCFTHIECIIFNISWDESGSNGDEKTSRWIFHWLLYYVYVCV